MQAKLKQNERTGARGQYTKEKTEQKRGKAGIEHEKTSKKTNREVKNRNKGMVNRTNHVKIKASGCLSCCAVAFEQKCAAVRTLGPA